MPTKTNAMSGQKMPPKLRLKLANECDNLLTKSKLNCLEKEYKFYLVYSKEVDEPTFARLMALFQSLMRDMYEKSSWGWNEQEKMDEWKHSKTRIMIVTKGDKSEPSKSILAKELPHPDEEIVGFMCFRFEIGADKGEAALYVYELHIDTEFQRQGLGHELMRMAKIFALEFKMDKIMLTVFRCNQPALDFYHKLKFAPDKSSPSKNESDYMILSSKVKG